MKIQADRELAASSQGSGVGPQYGSGLNVNRCNCPLSQREDQYQVVNNWTKILGNHSVKFGADLRYARNLRVPSDVNRAGEFKFGVGPTSSPTDQAGGLGFATFLLGDVTSLLAVRQHFDEREGVPEEDLLLRSGHLARHSESDAESRCPL